MRIPANCNTCRFKSLATKALSKDELSVLEGNCVTIRFKKGDLIFKQGIFSSDIIYLTEGVVKVHYNKEDDEQILKFVKAPSYIGISTSMKKAVNQYSTTAITDTTVCVINKEIFKTFIYKNGRFAYEIINELCFNELCFFRDNVKISQKHIHGRLADALLFFSEEIFESDQFTLPISREELGNYIHAARESVSRVLKEFASEDVIDLSGKKLKLKNKEKLEHYSKAY